MLKLNLTDGILKEMKGEMALLMGEQNLERNLDNLLRVPHSTGVYVLREGWSSSLKIGTIADLQADVLRILHSQ